MLAAKNTLIVRGQASVKLFEGQVSVLGAPLNRNRKLVVREDKQLPLEAETQADLDVLLAKSGEIFEIRGSTIPTSWSSAAEALVEMGQGMVMVMGATDVGKSTFCTYLANRMLRDGVRVRIVDADIGQADIGPPTTIGTSVPKGFLSSLVDLEPDALIFIGDTSPKQVETKLTRGIQRLSDRGRDSLTIINTDGWILDPEALSYKINLVNEVKPDLVIGLADHTELQPLLSATHSPSLRIDTAEVASERSRSYRRQIRQASYRRYLEGGKIQTIPLKGVNIQAPRNFPSIQASTSRELENLIVGLLDTNGYMLQIGIFMGHEGEAMRVYSKFVEGVRQIEFGYVKLSTDCTEVGYFEPQTPGRND